MEPKYMGPGRDIQLSRAVFTSKPIIFSKKIFLSLPLPGISGLKRLPNCDLGERSLCLSFPMRKMKVFSPKENFKRELRVAGAQEA